MKLTDWLEARLARTRSPWILGEIRISPGYLLTHREDLPEDARLELVSSDQAFLDLVRFDASGHFRPLRGAPGLCKGWRRGPLSATRLIADLQLLYPGAVALLAAWEEGRLAPTPFAETAGRQTGLYQGTRRLSSEDLPPLVGEICTQGCLRRPLWHAPELGSNTAGTLSLLCPEACPFFLHKARSRVKGPA
ncbi:DR2241 family protein [Methylacidimicrobium sp. B4]|uniref:DR2241 family protein n=1 Tax=Methylacidimicrobium sp. B4 TaxID=2796139 RepID=UPI001A907434|nr:DR2241 family protein [Methylacidimicrobium sp. B4]QSR84094.1 hypothetical protein MacB4_07495 [Methylacidimicrobium sp. B4]